MSSKSATELIRPLKCTLKHPVEVVYMGHVLNTGPELLQNY